ncbi:MAG: hypothetical protein JSV99_08185 [Planctomycetota bacterium]|nr:MAG: hypothetical protein JSV99_08185 [Planctomycetota bacterium]
MAASAEEQFVNGAEHGKEQIGAAGDWTGDQRQNQKNDKATQVIVRGDFEVQANRKQRHQKSRGGDEVIGIPSIGDKQKNGGDKTKPAEAGSGNYL